MNTTDIIKSISNLFKHNTLKSVDLLPEERILLERISFLNKRDKDITPELYQQLRAFEAAWLERHYDFNTVEGIESIPVSSDLPGAPSPDVSVKGHTGEVYYYLRHKAYEHEDADRIDLAIACLKKSNALLMCKDYYTRDECYALVKVLARAGYVDEAYREKDKIDCGYQGDVALKAASTTNKLVNKLNTDLVIMDAHGSVCPECAKYQGRVYSISGKNKLFPKVPAFYAQYGYVHEGCGHSFWSYEHGITDPCLDYTLKVHPLKDKRYGADIVAFSNRPFVDDRTDECKQAAETARKQLTAQVAKQRQYYDNMIETEARRGEEARDFKWLQENIPDKCPKSISSYRRMKTQNTKNFQVLKAFAAEQGRDI